MKKRTLFLTLATTALVVFSVILFVKLIPQSMPCSNAINAKKAQEQWDKSSSVRETIESISSGGTHASLRLDQERCNGKAFLHIEYDTATTRQKVNELLMNSPLKAIPVEWQNV